MKIFSKTLKIILTTVLLLVTAIVLLFGHKDIPLNELITPYTNEASSFMEIDGVSVHYRDEGLKTEQIPIVLIHGTASSLHTFEGWVSGLKSEYRVISLDLPGYGLTGPFASGDYSIENYVNFMQNFLSSLNVERCILVGNSLGGRIAWNYTLENASEVDKLILIDASGYPIKCKSIPLAFKLAKIPVINKMLTFITPRFIVQKSVENVYADKLKVTDKLVDRYYDLTLRAGNRKAFIDRSAVAYESVSYQKIPDIKQSTLVLWGEMDEFIPVEMAYSFHRDLANDTLIVLKDLGHVPMEENWRKSLQPVLDFLEWSN